MVFFFPQAHQDIDWLRGYDSLDTELQEIISTIIACLINTIAKLLVWQF
ncbi:MAG: hypothetical protein SAL07_09725 [Oscillatoria sp. PMC 1051.18]|nr:hypothetical protein [Oscillatoria sp. PMC 1051.18]